MVMITVRERSRLWVFKRQVLIAGLCWELSPSHLHESQNPCTPPRPPCTDLLPHYIKCTLLPALTLNVGIDVNCEVQNHQI